MTGGCPSFRIVRVVVTGASGFIGSALCGYLVDCGHEAVGMVRKSSDRSRLSAGIPVVTADVRDQPSLRAAFAGAQAVVHCAAIVDPYAGPWDSRSINFIAAFNVCHAAVDAGVERLVYTSSASVYARDNARRPLTEDGSRIVKDPPVYDTYSINKASAEKYIGNFGDGGKLHTTALRFGGVYGPGDRLSGGTLTLLREGRAPVIGRPDVRVPLIFIDDLLSAAELALGRDGVPHRAYNLDGPSPLRLREFLEGLRLRSGATASVPVVPLPVARIVAWGIETGWRIQKREGAPPFNRFDVELVAADFVLDRTRATAELGWEPRVDLETGLDRTWEWLERQPAMPARYPMFA